MYATIVQTAMHTLCSADACGRTGRTLANALAALPGFVVFVALDADTASGTVAMLCIFAEQASIAAAEEVIAQWQGDAHAAVGHSIQRLGAGTVIAQKGL